MESLLPVVESHLPECLATHEGPQVVELSRWLGAGFGGLRGQGSIVAPRAGASSRRCRTKCPYPRHLGNTTISFARLWKLLATELERLAHDTIRREARNDDWRNSVLIATKPHKGRAPSAQISLPQDDR
jgi:hypothetical protein